jgi:hypothetical protein
VCRTSEQDIELVDGLALVEHSLATPEFLYLRHRHSAFDLLSS